MDTQQLEVLAARRHSLSRAFIHFTDGFGRAMNRWSNLDSNIMLYYTNNITISIDNTHNTIWTHNNTQHTMQYNIAS